MEPKTPQDFIGMAKRQKWWIIIPFIASIVLSYGYYKRAPKIYKATTLILVREQEVSEDYVKSTVGSSVSDRLNTLAQQILSRTHLERVAKEYSLYSDKIGTLTMEEIIEAMRKAIIIEVQQTRSRDRNIENTFTISYEGRDPRKVMMVTNRLASLFIEENLKAREKQAVGTSDFLEGELSVIEVALKEKEKDIRAFKEGYMGELPGQLDANLKILERLQDQIKNNTDSRKASEERRIMLQREISELSGQITSGIGDGVVLEDSPFAKLTQLKARLSELRSMYTDKHPDVIDTKIQIARLENDIVQQGNVNEKASSKGSPPILNPSVARLKAELSEVELEITRLKIEEKSLKKQIAEYQRRVEITPKREQELAALTRDYNLLEANYQSLLDKKIHAKMAENLERQQLGERYKVLDPARMPEKPFKPEPQKIMLVGAFLGLLLGGGLGYMRETMDRSFHKIEEIEDVLSFPVIATLPRIKTRGAGKKNINRRVKEHKKIA